MKSYVNYVLGFRIWRTESTTDVVLIKKNRPQWQAGKYNGVGGHVDEGEFHIDAMVREFAEETSMQTTPEDWDHFATLQNTKRSLVCYRSFGSIDGVATMTDEPVAVISWPVTPTIAIVPNLLWIIPMALDERVQRSTIYAGD